VTFFGTCLNNFWKWFKNAQCKIISKVQMWQIGFDLYFSKFGDLVPYNGNIAIKYSIFIFIFHILVEFWTHKKIDAKAYIIYFVIPNYHHFKKIIFLMKYPRLKHEHENSK
jgi:hypothetical protein